MKKKQMQICLEMTQNSIEQFNRDISSADTDPEDVELYKSMLPEMKQMEIDIIEFMATLPE